MGGPGLEQLRNQNRQPIKNPLGDLILRRWRLTCIRDRCAGDDSPYQGSRCRLKHPVKLTHAGSTTRPSALQALRLPDQSDRLFNQPAPRQQAHQPLQQPFPHPRRHNPVRTSTAGKRHIEHWLAPQVSLDAVQLLINSPLVVDEDRCQQPTDRRPCPRPATWGPVRPTHRPRGRPHLPAGQCQSGRQ